MSATNLDSRLQSQELYLDSAYATINTTNNGNGDVYFFLSAPVLVGNDHDIVLRLDNFTLPISFFLLDTGNNSLVINGITYTIAPGNYNALTLASTIDALIPQIATYTASNNKFTFTSNSAFTVSGSSTCFGVIGFNSGTDQVATLSGGKYTLTSTYIVNLSGTPIVYIDIPNLTTRNISSKNNGGFTTIVKSIIQNVPYGSILSYVNNTMSAVVLREKYISYIHVRLLDSNYNILNLNGQNFNLTLELFFYNNGSAPNDSSMSLTDLVNSQEQIKNDIFAKGQPKHF